MNADSEWRQFLDTWVGLEYLEKPGAEVEFNTKEMKKTLSKKVD